MISSTATELAIDRGESLSNLRKLAAEINPPPVSRVRIGGLRLGHRMQHDVHFIAVQAVVSQASIRSYPDWVLKIRHRIRPAMPRFRRARARIVRVIQGFYLLLHAWTRPLQAIFQQHACCKSFTAPILKPPQHIADHEST